MKEGTIKSVYRGKRTLEHSRHRNFLGFLVDTFILTITDITGHRTHYHIMPPIKTNNYLPSSSITDDVVDYTDEEMVEELMKFKVPTNEHNKHIKFASKITVGAVGSTGTGKRKGRLERMMNHFGWYRSSEWYILRESQLTRYPFLGMVPKLKDPIPFKRNGVAITPQNADKFFPGS